MDIYRTIGDRAYKFELTPEERKAAAYVVEKEKRKTLAEVVADLPQGGSLTVTFGVEGK